MSYLQKLKRPSFYTLVFFFLFFFIINSRSNQIKESRTPFCRYCWVGNLRKMSAKKFKVYGSWARQRFQFFRQRGWFSGNNRALPKFTYLISYFILSIIELWKSQSAKVSFILTTWAIAIIKSFRSQTSQELIMIFDQMESYLSFVWKAVLWKKHL